MRHPVRRLAGLPALLLCSALFLAPGAALADHDDHRRREHRHEHASFHQNPWLAVHAGWRFGPQLRRQRHHVRAASYYCAHCHHGFDRRRPFYRHLRHEHAVPFARLPFVLMHTSFGWVFGG